MDKFELRFGDAEETKIYYVKNRTSRKPERLIEEGENTLIRRYEEKFLMEQEIEFSDKIILAYPTEKKHPDIKRVKIKDIKTFRLLINPSEKWQSIIEEGNKRLEIEYGHDEAQRLKSLWYHEIMKNHKNRSYINEQL